MILGAILETTLKNATDGGDCDEFNDTGCIQEWIADNFCDPQLNTEFCNFDGGDCEGRECIEEWAGDGFCDLENNLEDCNFDDGDCWLLQ